LQVDPPSFDTKILKTNEIRITPNPSDGEFDVYIDETLSYRICLLNE
jgi:hypothetical protein